MDLFLLLLLVAVQWLKFMLRIRNITGSILDPEAGYLSSVFRGFS